MVAIKKDFISSRSSNRPGQKIKATHITVHETANTGKGANAKSHARYVKGADARRRSVSWHFTVDDSEIIQHLPTDELAWHAGTTGNRQSIGVELCVNKDGNFEQTKKNAAWLIKKLMKEHGVSLGNVVTHKYWTGKQCPARLLKEWSAFKKLIKGGSSSSGSGSKSKKTKEYVHLPKTAKTWRTYKLNVAPVKKNSDWSLTPARYSGLTYEVLGKPYPHVVTIKTGRGKRNIYVAPSTGAKVFRK
ncbi:N-acetylmuramoyl-L-alanine amidase [Bacillus sp. FSL W7-1360]